MGDGRADARYRVALQVDAGIGALAVDVRALAIAEGHDHVILGAGVAVIAGISFHAGSVGAIVHGIAEAVAIGVGLGDGRADARYRVALQVDAGIRAVTEDREAPAFASGADLVVVGTEVAVIAGITDLSGYQRAIVIGIADAITIGIRQRYRCAITRCRVASEDRAWIGVLAEGRCARAYAVHTDHITGRAGFSIIARCTGFLCQCRHSGTDQEGERETSPSVTMFHGRERSRVIHRLHPQ